MLHSAADGELLLGRRLGWITVPLLVAGEDSDEPAPLTDGPLACVGFARIGQEDFGAGEIDAPSLLRCPRSEISRDCAFVSPRTSARRGPFRCRHGVANQHQGILA